MKKGYLNLSNDYTNYSSNKKRITDFDRAKAYILYIYIYLIHTRYSRYLFFPFKTIYLAARSN